MTELIYSMCQASLNQLNTLQKKSPKKQVKNAIKKVLGKNVMPDDPVFWPAGMLILGLSEAIITDHRQNEGALSPYGQEILSALEKYTSSWLGKYPASATRHVDDALAGYAFTRLYLETFVETFKEGADRIADFIINAKTDAAGSIIYHPERGNSYIFADGSGMTALFLAKYGSAFHITKALEASQIQLLNFQKYGFDRTSALPYHGFDYDSKEKKGLVGWGRAIGWLMMGYSEVTTCATDSKRNSLLEDYISLCKSVISFQREDGSFSWQPCCIEAHADTSATAMIAYSLKLFVANLADKNVIDQDTMAAITASIDSAREYILSQIKDGVATNSLGECIDFSMHPQKYGTYPWGQGAALALLSL